MVIIVSKRGIDDYTIQKECRKLPSAEQMAVFDRFSNLAVELVAKLAEKQLTTARNMTIDNELVKLFEKLN